MVVAEAVRYRDGGGGGDGGGGVVVVVVHVVVVSVCVCCLCMNVVCEAVFKSCSNLWMFKKTMSCSISIRVILGKII